MAVGRVGGTKALIRGQVGKDIYQVKKGSDGIYSQIIYEKGVRTETTLTPRLQAQRMCMAMVESIMKDLKPVLGISFQGENSRSRSANKFSSINAKLVMDDCRTHWYADNLFVFPSRHRTDIEVKDLGGPFVISKGTLNYNLFDWYGDDVVLHHIMKDIPFPNGYFVGMVFNCQIGVTTIGEFLNNHRMTMKDCVAFCGYSEWVNYADNPDDPQSDAQHHYILAEINPNLSFDTVMTEAVIKSMFKVQSDIQASVYIQTDNLAFGIGHAANVNDIDETWYYTAAFSISYYSGKQLISSSAYANTDYGDLPWLRNSQPANVFGSWMGEPQRKPYPSPFAPTPTPRLPLEYQEVSWVRRLSGKPLYISKVFNVRYDKIDTKFSNDFLNGGIFFGCVETTCRAFLYCHTISGVDYWRWTIKLSTEAWTYTYIPYLDGQNVNHFVFEPKQVGFSLTFNDVVYDNNSRDWGEFNEDRTFDIWGTSSYLSVFKAYETKILDSRTQGLKLHLIPCYRKSDGFCGFYDLVSSRFFTAQANAGEYDHGDIVIT